MGGFDRSRQPVIIGEALQDAIAMAFELDEKLWGDQKKNIHGVENGQPYTLTYVPSREIRGDYTVDVEYGLMAGLDPNRALVWGPGPAQTARVPLLDASPTFRCP